MSRRDGGRTTEYEEQDFYRREPARDVLRDAPPVRTRERERDYEEVDIYKRRGPDPHRPEFLRDDYSRPDQGPLVLRERETETFTRPAERAPSPTRTVRSSRFVERSPSPVREVSRVRTRFVERSPSPPPMERVRTRIVERERSPSLPPMERVRTRIVERERRSPSPVQNVRARFVERSPSPEREFRRMKIVERERERSPSPERAQLRMRVIERTERAREPSPEPLPPPPIIIEKPPIHQEIITHHRHIDHGFERAPTPRVSPPPALRPKPREREQEETEIDIYTGRGKTEVDIYKSGGKSHRRGESREVYDDDILFERDRERLRTKETKLTRRRSVDSRPRERERIPDALSEAEYYNRRAEERGFMGEAYNGATKDWAIVDVPPGTERVTMDGVGGGSEEITWQRYNGVRRSKFIPERERDRERVEIREIEAPPPRESRKTYEYESEEIIDRRVGLPRPERRRSGDMWTEITKDLVVREAIEQMGYDFEETEYFYYVIQYLRYEDVLQLVQLSEDIRRERQERIREMEWERERLEERRLRDLDERRKWERRERESPYEDERIIEREIVYDGPPRRGVPRGYLR